MKLDEMFVNTFVLDEYFHLLPLLLHNNNVFNEILKVSAAEKEIPALLKRDLLTSEKKVVIRLDYVVFYSMSKSMKHMYMYVNEISTQQLDFPQTIKHYFTVIINHVCW